MTEIKEVLYRWVKGLSIRQISKSLGTARNTVKKIIRQAQEKGALINADLEVLEAVALAMQTSFPATTPVKKTTEEQLSIYHNQLEQWLNEPYITVRQIGRLLSQPPYNLSLSERSLHRYVDKYFPKDKKVTMVLHTKAGEQAQVDFGYVGLLYDPGLKKKRKSYAFVMTLSYSRHRFVCFVFLCVYMWCISFYMFSFVCLSGF